MAFVGHFVAERESFKCSCGSEKALIVSDSLNFRFNFEFSGFFNPLFTFLEFVLCAYALKLPLCYLVAPLLIISYMEILK